ncbi:MAG: nitrogen fixation protein NifX [Gammaproteobacteria bacterium]
MTVTRRMKILSDTHGDIVMDTAIKVAFATTDMENVNQHFGSAKSFVIYAVDMEQTQLLEVAQFGELAQDGNEDKLAAKIALIGDCAAVYCQAIGASAVKQLMAQGIQPVKVQDDSQVKALLCDLQNELKSGPSAWLAKAINKNKSHDPDRFAQMDADGWDE